MIIFDNATFGRVMMLDGVVQLTTKDEFIYHEMMAHVPLFSLGAERAKRVLVIGGGDGGVMREVLKHKSVERLVLCEIDRTVVDISKEHLPTISQGAFDDARVEVVIADGVRYVAETPERFDAIIVNSTEPVRQAAVLFTAAFFEGCARCLSEPGVLITQNGLPFLHPDHLAGTMALFAAIFADKATYLVDRPPISEGRSHWPGPRTTGASHHPGQRSRRPVQGFGHRYALLHAGGSQGGLRASALYRKACRLTALCGWGQLTADNVNDTNIVRDNGRTGTPMTLAPLLSAAPQIQIHAFAAMSAFALGLVQFAAPKGTLPHRALGWLWALLMTVVAVSAFFIHTLKVWGLWSPIHLLAIFTLVMLPPAVWRAHAPRGRAQARNGRPIHRCADHRGRIHAPARPDHARRRLYALTPPAGSPRTGPR